MDYFLGAYYLLKLKPLGFGELKGKKVITGSSCINESYFDAWSLSWTEDGKNNLSIPCTEFGIAEEQVKKIQKWADENFENKKLGWVNTFENLETLIEYKNKFFELATDFVAIGIYFEETAIQEFVNEFEPQSKDMGSIGILDVLKAQKKEKENKEIFIGYDLIGMEFGGSYHSFHCYDYSKEMNQKFKIELNDNGLIKDFEKKKELKEYANNPDNGLPFVPWYLVKVKKVIL